MKDVKQWWKIGMKAIMSQTGIKARMRQKI